MPNSACRPPRWPPEPVKLITQSASRESSEAFDPPVKPRDVGVELYRQDRRRTAVLGATRAVAAGYRLSETGGSREDLAAVAHAAGRLAPGTPISDIPSSYTFIERAVDAIWAAGYRLVSEESS